ncbi:hypothetical protein Tco_1175346 [Tanacetum coccineum]
MVEQTTTTSSVAVTELPQKRRREDGACYFVHMRRMLHICTMYLSFAAQYLIMKKDTWQCNLLSDMYKRGSHSRFVVAAMNGVRYHFYVCRVEPPCVKLSPSSVYGSKKRYMGNHSWVVVATMNGVWYHICVSRSGIGYQENDKNKAETDKNEHGNGKSAKKPKPKAYPSSTDQPGPT